MRRIFTSSAALLLLCAVSNVSNAQCSTNISGNLIADLRVFNTSAEGFGGEFVYSGNSGGTLLSDGGGVRTVVTVTYAIPTSDPTIRWGFDLSGPANISSYAATAIYGDGTSEVSVCAGGAISNGEGLTFAAPVPAEIVGKRFKLKITFFTPGDEMKNLYIDNFRTNAFESQIILPVRFSGLNASVQSNGNVGLIWRVDAEENLAGYSVERSSDGVRYASIGYVAAAGQSRYSFTDAAPIANAFYRIKSVDVDGKAGYSTIVNVRGDRSSVIMKAYFSASNTIMVQHDEALSGARITVSTADGRLVRSVIPQVGAQQTTVGLAGGATGMYIVRFESPNGEASTFKLMKN